MLNNGRSTIKIALVIFFVLLLCGYVTFQARKIISGPRISVESPTDGATVASSKIVVEGSAQNISFIYLDNRKIYTNDNGQFKETLLLFPGTNVIELKVEDKFGKTRSEKSRSIDNLE